MMRFGSCTAYLTVFAGCFLWLQFAYAFDSGSTGADGIFVPVEDTVVELPADGVLNYTEVNIAESITVTFKKNAANTPVRMLVSGDVVVAGTISVDGSSAAPVGSGGDGNPADDGASGIGGPGGYDGGRGGRARPELGDIYSLFSPEDALAVAGEWGQGPGGGAGARLRRDRNSYSRCFASKGNFANTSGIDFASTGFASRPLCALGDQELIPAYGTATILPLIGGSGGGGGLAQNNANGSGGGGGGGAILIAAGGMVHIDSGGTISADGGNGGGTGGGTGGGGGSGGAVRIIASTVSGGGRISAAGGSGGIPVSRIVPGRIRIEAESFLYRGGTTPRRTIGSPGALYFAGRPSIRIISVGGRNAPEQPTGAGDISFADTVAEDVLVSIEARNVPLDAEVSVRMIPAAGSVVISSAAALDGTLASSITTAMVSLPEGPGTIQAFASFPVSVSDFVSQSLYRGYTGGELVAHVYMASGDDAGMVLTTASGREVVVRGLPWSGGAQ